MLVIDPNSNPFATTDSEQRPEKRSHQVSTFEKQYTLKEACEITALKSAMLKRLAESVPGVSKVKVGPKKAHFHWTFSESALRMMLNRMQGGYYVPKKEPGREKGAEKVTQISRP